MRIGILKAGQPPADLEPLVGSYPAMIRRCLGSSYTYREFNATQGDLPAPDTVLDGYVITGSSASAYNTDAWIARLREWLQRLDPETPLVGICFGHQIMADAYGGVAQRAANGMALGLHEYTVRLRERWMGDVTHFTLPAVHYDQVIEPPREARVTASSEFCPYAVLSYTTRRALSFQAHPEFALNYVATLIDRRERRGAMRPDEADAARTSMRRAHDCARVGGWIRLFLEGREDDATRSA